MHSEGSILGGTTARRSMALLACVALLYFAAGGSLFHEHTNGPDGSCHTCQALHLPALAAARPDFSNVFEFVTRFSSLAQHAAPSEAFSLQHAGRAPPTV